MADQLLRATAANGGIRIVGVITTQLTEIARQRHQLSYVATAALGRTMAAGLLLASSMKRTEARINIRVKGNGPLGGIMVDAGMNGTVRGYVGNPDVELPPTPNGKLDVGGAVGPEGYLYVVRDVGYGYPYSSTVELISGEIGDDLTYYLVSSEQTPSRLILGVFVDSTGVTAAGGLLVQALVNKLDTQLATVTGFTPLLRDGKTLPQIFEQLVGDMGLEILPETQLVQFHCDCSFDRVLGALKMYGEAELRDMIEQDNGAEATCHFCGEVYKASSDELEQLIEELRVERAEASP
jgi:molecular chaperone Hsp33